MQLQQEFPLPHAYFCLRKHREALVSCFFSVFFALFLDTPSKRCRYSSTSQVIHHRHHHLRLQVHILIDTHIYVDTTCMTCSSWELFKQTKTKRKKKRNLLNLERYLEFVQDLYIHTLGKRLFSLRQAIPVSFSLVYVQSEHSVNILSTY